MNKTLRKQSKMPSVDVNMQRTPFFPRLEALSRVQDWENWAGYLVASTLDTVEKEYFAVRNASTLFDITPMCTYRFKGKDARKVLDRIVTRNVKKIRTGRVGYALWCDEEGMVIDDGTIFRLGKDEFLLLCADFMYSWFLDAAWGFDVVITDETNDICGLAVQGPTSYSVLKDAGFKNVETMKPFDLREIEPGIWLSRTGYTGDLGYEILTANKNALKLWDRLWDAGSKHWGLRPIGTAALDLVRLETGFIAPKVDFQPVHIVSRVGRGRTPFELGFGKLVHFDKGHFNGRRALLEHQKNGTRFNLVKLDIEDKYPAHSSYIYHGKNKHVGFVTSAAWSPTTKRNIAYAELEAPYGDKIRDGLWAEVYVDKEGKWYRINAKATVIDGPFFAHPRARQTPPGPF